MTTQTLPMQIFAAADGKVSVEVRYENNSLRLNEQQMATVFEIDRTAISKHIKNIVKSWELSQDSVCAIFAHTAEDGKKYQVKHYNLDMIISVWYRVNSIKATNFRKRATSILKEYTTLSRTGVKHLEETLQFLKKTVDTMNLTGDEGQAIIDIVLQYTTTRVSLYQYDTGTMALHDGTPSWDVRITTDLLLQQLTELQTSLRAQWTATDLFAQEKYTGTLAGIIGNIFQTYDGNDVYSTIESKAAHLLYFIIKDHPFHDGNKRSGAFLFIVFLKYYGILYDTQSNLKINDRGLTALALLIAQSDPKHKELMIQLVTFLLQ
jgi:prophage maintenance system killer protein